MGKRMINTHCHGCSEPMQLEAKPVTLTDMNGETKTYYGKASAVWICKTCRVDPYKLRSARLAAGMPASPTMPAGFDADEEESNV